MSSYKILLFSLIISIISLLAAFIAQYGFALAPCELCLFQRVPYALVIFLAALGLKKPAWQKIIINLIMLVFLSGGLLAAYHAGVEKHLLPGPTACTSSPSSGDLSIDDLRKRIMNAPVIACDEPQWEFHGITMAALNSLWSFILVYAIFYAKGKKKHA
ncbi:MAG: disulfide bond formation protein B [Pseudomonadota bacterium]